MDISQQSIFFSIVTICACVVASSSVPSGSLSGQHGASRSEDLAHLVTLISKLKTMARARQHHSSSSPGSALPAIITTSNNDDGFLSTSSRLVSEFPDDIVDDLMIGEGDDNDDDDGNLDEDVLTKGYLGNAKSSSKIGAAKKRQGAWSYDYGLGGGRFGKRNYGDYGIGGGRFGRDVDHVDLSDASDLDPSS